MNPGFYSEKQIITEINDGIKEFKKSALLNHESFKTATDFKMVS